MTCEFELQAYSILGKLRTSVAHMSNEGLSELMIWRFDIDTFQKCLFAFFKIAVTSVFLFIGLSEAFLNQFW